LQVSLAQPSHARTRQTLGELKLTIIFHAAVQ
jgi:hypothetical protein